MSLSSLSVAGNSLLTLPEEPEKLSNNSAQFALSCVEGESYDLCQHLLKRCPTGCCNFIVPPSNPPHLLLGEGMLSEDVLAG